MPKKNIPVQAAMLTAASLFLMTPSGQLQAQTGAVIIPSNTSTGSLEKNILFYANRRYQVTQTGPSIPLWQLFDGSMQVAQTSAAVTPANPLVITIENLPNSMKYHTQAGAWIGWSTRFLYPARFKIEVYDVYAGANTWKEIANVSGNTQRHYMVTAPHGMFTKIRFTFYEGNPAAGTNQGFLQLSELFYIHPEGAQIYDGMVIRYEPSGNVGIGSTNPQAKLAVNGNILATEVKVKTDISVPDYVFEADYELPTLNEIEAYVKEHKHLPEIPSAADIKQDGLDLAEMNLLLLKKVEELTLHLIEKDKSERVMTQELEFLKKEVAALKAQNERINK